MVLAAALAPSSCVTPTRLASLLLDRSCPRPASRGAAETWWRETLAAVENGRILLEGVWQAEEEVPNKLDEKEGRRAYAEALTTLPAGHPASPRQREDFTMGHVMPKLRGRVAGRVVRRWVREEIA
jgi:hypothetical protein